MRLNVFRRKRRRSRAAIRNPNGAAFDPGVWPTDDLDVLNARVDAIQILLDDIKTVIAALKQSRLTSR